MKTALALLSIILALVIGCQYRYQNGTKLGEEPITSTDNVIAYGELSPYADFTSIHTQLLDPLQKRIDRLSDKNGRYYFARRYYFNEHANWWEVYIPDGPATDLIYIRHTDINTIMDFLEQNQDSKLFQ